MTNVSKMAEQHMLEYESRQRHVSELLGRVREKADLHGEHADLHNQVEALKQEQDKLTVRLDELRLKDPEHWREETIERSGLMGLWDALAQQAERLVERLEK